MVKTRAEASGRIEALALEVARDEVARARVPVHLRGTDATDGGRVAPQGFVSHVEGGQDPGVQEAVPEAPDPFGAVGPTRGAPQDDLSGPRLDTEPALRP